MGPGAPGERAGFGVFMAEPQEPFNFLRDVGYFLLGSALKLEEALRWEAARLLIRWNELVLKGEDDESPSALNLKKGLDEFFERVQQDQAASDRKPPAPGRPPEGGDAP